MLIKLLTGLALLLVVEGLMPFVNPNGFRRYLAGLLSMPDTTLRLAGLISMVAGVVLLLLISA